MTAPLEDRRGFGVGDRRAGTSRERRILRGRRPHREPTNEQTIRSRSCEEPVKKTRRARFLPFPVTAEGTVDLPAGAVVVALDFKDDGGLGYRRRPATAWAEVVTEDSTDRLPDTSSPIA
jgi:hypothetical protein